MMSQITKPKSQCLWVCVIVVTWYFDVVQQIVLIFKRASNLSKPVVCECWSNQEMACGWNTHPRVWCILRERTENTQWCGTHISMATYTYTTAEVWFSAQSCTRSGALRLICSVFCACLLTASPAGKSPSKESSCFSHNHVAAQGRGPARFRCSLSEEGLRDPRRGPCFHLVPLGFIKDL